MKRTFSFNLEQDFIQRLDAIVISPVSRSDVLNDLLEYALQNKEFVEAIVNNKLDSFKSLVESIEHESMQLSHDVIDMQELKTITQA